MEFERTDYDVDGDARYMTVIDSETVFIIITGEALDDDLKDGLTADKQAKLEAIVTTRLTSGQLVKHPDKIGVLVDVILVKTGDLT